MNTGWDKGHALIRRRCVRKERGCCHPNLSSVLGNHQNLGSMNEHTDGRLVGRRLTWSSDTRDGIQLGPGGGRERDRDFSVCVCVCVCVCACVCACVRACVCWRCVPVHTIVSFHHWLVTLNSSGYILIEKSQGVCVHHSRSIAWGKSTNIHVNTIHTSMCTHTHTHKDMRDTYFEKASTVLYRKIDWTLSHF